MIAKKIKDQAEKAVTSYLKSLDSTGAIADEIHRILRNHIETIVAQAIGFKKDSWRSEWNIERYSDQPGVREVAQQAERHARVLIVELMDSFEFKLSGNEMKQLQGYYRARVKEAIKDRLTVMAEQKAEELAMSIINEAIKNMEEK